MDIIKPKVNQLLPDKNGDGVKVDESKGPSVPFPVQLLSGPLEGKERATLMEEELNEESILEYERMVKMQMDKLELAKEALRNKKDREKKERDRQLKVRLEVIEKEMEDDRRERLKLRHKLNDLREKQTKDLSLGREFGREVWRLEAEHTMEEIARRKLELKSINHQRELVENAIQSKVTQMDAIKDEKVKRGIDSTQRVEALLDKALTLKGLLDDGLFDKETWEDMSIKMVEASNQEHEEVFRVADEIAIMRRKRLEELRADRQNQIREYNDMRYELEKKQKESRKRKHDMLFLKSKGTDFLAEIEFGNAPPVEFILKNRPRGRSNNDQDILDQDEHSSGDDDGLDVPVDELIRTLENEYIPKVSKAKTNSYKDQLKELAEERQYGEGPYAKMRPYDGSWGVMSVPASKRDLYMSIQGVVYDMYDRIFSRYNFNKYSIKQAKTIEEEWLLSKTSVEYEHDQQIKEGCIKSLSYELQTQVIAQMSRDIYREMVIYSGFCTDIVNQALLSAVDPGKENNPTYKPQLAKDGLIEMQRARAALDKKTYGGITLLEPSTHSLRLITMDEARKEPPTKVVSSGLFGLTKTVVKEEEPEEVVDDNAIDETLDKMYTKELVHIDTFLLSIPPAVAKNEGDYWKKISFTVKPLEFNISSKFGNITALSLSRKLLIAVGTASGYILVMSAVNKVQLLREFHDKMTKNTSITQLSWSADGCSQLIAVTAKHDVVVFRVVSPIDKEQPHPKPLLATESGKYSLKTLTPINELNMEDMRRPVEVTDVALLAKLEAKDKILMQPQHALFHPELSNFGVTGHQSNIIVGCSGGELVKSKSTRRDGPALKSDLREFFHAHTKELAFVGFSTAPVSRGEVGVVYEMVTVDIDGRIYIWPYSKDYFSGFNWYIPSRKIKFIAQLEGSKGEGGGNLLSVKMTTDGNDLILLWVFPKAKTPVFRIYVVDLVKVVLRNIQIQIPMASSPSSKPAVIEPSPYIDGLYSDYVYFMQGRWFEVFSLVTGKSVFKRDVPAEDANPFTHIGIDWGHKVLTVSSLTKLCIFDIADANDEAVRLKNRHCYAERFWQTTRSQRVTRFSWPDIDGHNSYYFIRDNVVMPMVESAMKEK